MNSGNRRHFSGGNSTGNKMKSSYLINFDGPANDFHHVPPATGDPRLPLSNLSTLCQKMNSLQQFLSDSINGNTLLGKDQMYMVSSEITSAIHQIMANGTVLLASSQNLRQGSVQVDRNALDQSDLRDPVSTATDLTGSRLVKPVDLTVWMSYPVNENSTDVECFPANQADVTSMMSSLSYEKMKDGGDLKEEVMKVEIDDGECEVVEIDAVELLAEHVHFCDICGKGFKRDANLRMHMRAHGNQFKTPEALAKPDCVESSRKTRFSCPAVGCNRNKSHNKFQPLKSVICVKNHFKRSHCPKLYSCNRCNKKSFSVVSDLKSHIKHCGESKWRCSCGTTFSRKDKLFGHMALFEGHMPEEDEKEKSKGAADMQEDEEKIMVDTQLESLDSGFFDGVLDGLGGIDNDVFGSPTFDARMREFYEMP